MRKRIPILLGFILIAFAVWLQITPIESIRLLIARLDNLAYDMQLRTKIFTHPASLNTNVVIVDIDDKTISQEGRWPWPREKIAVLMDRLKQEGAVVIAMDMMFPEHQINATDTVKQALSRDQLDTSSINRALTKIQPALDGDAKLAKSLGQQDVILGMTFLPRKETTGLLSPPALALTTPSDKKLDFIDAEGYISNIPILQNAAKNNGFINVYADPDGIIRRVPLLMRYHDNLYPSLAFEAVRLFLLSKIEITTAEYNNHPEVESIRLGSHIIPVDINGSILIPFIGRSFTFPYYSAADVLHQKIPANALAGKIVFLGTSATGLGDLRATAIQGVFPGVEIQASIAEGILKDHYSFRPGWTQGAEIFITVFLGCILVFLFPFLGPRSLAILCIVIPVLLIFANNELWQQTGLIIFILIPCLLTIALGMMNMVYGYLFETRHRERLKDMFGQYVPEQHIEEMLKASGHYGLLGEDREMTVLFADIRNFTTISEPMTAAELKELLNQFFTPITEVIFKYKGTIDKYIGDLVMAFWGAPMRDKEHAEHALSAAIEMQVAVEKLKPIFAAKGWAEIKIGIGIHTGVMSVGDMGSQFRRNYTVLGDAVNLGSRLEGLTKYYGVKIITAEASQKNQAQFIFRQLDRVQVKGKKLSIAIYEVLGWQKNLTTNLKKELSLSEKALAFYFAQQWTAAEEVFTNLHHEHPGTKLYKLYLERISEFKVNPPPKEWDGTYTHLSK